MAKYLDMPGLTFFYNQIRGKFASKTDIGTPLAATAKSSMTDPNKIYVYTGVTDSDPGMKNGYWYYKDGNTWVEGGIYNSIAVATDTSLSESGMAADAEAVGDKFTDLKSDINILLGNPSNVDLSTATTYNVAIGATSNTWNGSSGNSSYFIPIPVEATNVSFTSHLSNDSVYAFLTSDSHSVGQTPSYASGSTRTIISANTTSNLEIPNNANYLLIHRTVSGNNYTPQSVSFTNSNGVMGSLSSKLDKPNSAGTTGQFLMMGQSGNEWTTIVTEVDDTLTQANTPADAKATGDNIRHIQNAIDDIIVVNYADGIQQYTGKAINYSTGASYDSGSYTATGYIDVSDFSSITYSRYCVTSSTVPTGGMAFYNSSKTNIPNSGEPYGYGYGYESAGIYLEDISIPENAVYVRFSIPTEYLSQLAVYETTQYENNKIAKIEEDLMDAESSLSEISYKMTLSDGNNNLWAIGTISEGQYLRSTDGALLPGDYDTTAFIPVTSGSKLYGQGLRYWFYDSSKSTISGATGVLNNASELISGSGIHVITVPENAVYFRVCVAIGSPKILYTPNYYEQYLSSTSGVTTRKLYCLGDSITRGMYAEPGTSSSSGPTDKGYTYLIGQTHGYTVVNLGNSGSGWANLGTAETAGDPSTSYNAKNVVDNNSFNDADIITLAYGVNDWKGASQNVVLGSMSSQSGDGTVIGNMKYCIETLVTKKPTAQIIVLLPLNTNRQWSGMATMTLEDNWAFGYAYRNNQTLQDYRNAIRECAEYYNIKVVDLEEVCPINRLNLRDMCGDGLHPTRQFHKLMGLAIAPHIT